MDNELGLHRLERLRAFCNAARLGSITRAAERLYLSQPSLSQQVNALEEELATRLFYRDGPRIALTPAGENLYRLAASLVDGLDRLPDLFAESHGGSRESELRIAAGEVTAAFVLPPFLKQLRDRYPDIRLHVRTGTGREVIDWLLGYEVEMAVGAPDFIHGELDTRSIFSYHHVLIVPLDHPLAGRESVEIRDISTYPLIMPTPDTRTRQIADFVLYQHQVTPKAVVEVNGWIAAKSYVEAGFGITVVPEVCLTDQDRVWRMPAKQYYPKRLYGVTKRFGESLSPAARGLVEIMDPDCPAEWCG